MRKTLGITFICISAFLYGIRYLAAAIYGSNTQTWSKDLFKSMLDYVGSELVVLSWISLIAGIVLIIFSVFKKRMNNDIQQIKKRINNDIQQIKENWNKDL